LSNSEKKEEKMIKRKIFTVFSIILMGLVLSGNSHAAEKKKFVPISYEVSLGFGMTRTINNFTINKVPHEFRILSTHAEDPYLALDILPDSSPFFANTNMGGLNGSVKIWVFSVIGLGLRGWIENRPHIVEDEGISRMITDRRDEVYVGGAEVNYAEYYHNWKPAYIMYQIGGVQKDNDATLLGLFVEVKTPTIDFRISESKWLGIGLFAGYEPVPSRNISIYATSGWHRWGEFEEKIRCKIGEIKFDRVYGGLNLEVTGEKSGFGLSFSVIKNIQKTHILRDDFGLEFKDLPLTFGVGLYVIINAAR